MTLTDVFDIAGAVMISLGGAVAIMIALSSWLGKLWAKRILAEEKAQYAEDLAAFKTKLELETESHKIRLKKSELIFARELDAASALVAIVRDISPSHTRPGMDSYDVCDDIAQNFGMIERLISKYCRAHGAVLSESVRDMLYSCMAIAGENQLETFDGDVSNAANSAADQLYTKLLEAQAAMLAQVNSQVTK